ncbi:hypothetical protein C8R47DRAFT_1074035 [Mycena vitilis]|nr:hypothetical protein C8R47DRAFT_1074035 [Mycena vitilis]
MQFPPPKLNIPQDNPGERQPDHLVSPMGPIPCEVLRREPSSSFGPIDHQPPATNAFSRVRAASSSEWITPSTTGLLDAVGDAIGDTRTLQLRSARNAASSASAQDGQLAPSQGANEPRGGLQLAIPRAVGRFLGTRPTLPSIAQLGLPTVAFQSSAPPRLSLANGHGTRYPAPSYRFLTHPPEQIPASVTAPMQHAGVMRNDGHHVWTVPTGPGAVVHYPNGRAPDTPRPPLRMLDDMPELESRAPGSDAEMPDATDTDAEGSDDEGEANATCQRWAVSNCRLEKIQTEERRIAVDPSLSQNEASPFVLNALQIEGVEPEFPGGGVALKDLAAAAAVQKELEGSRNDVQEFEVDIEKGELEIETVGARNANKLQVFLPADKSSREGEGKETGQGGKGGESSRMGTIGPGGLTGPVDLDSAHGLQGLDSAHGPLFTRSDSSLSSLADSLPSLLWDQGHHPPTPPSRAASLPPLVSDSGRYSPAAPLYVDDHDVSVESSPTVPGPQHTFRVATPFSEDCRSTAGVAGFLDNGIFGEGAITYNFPTFSDDSADEEDPVKLIEAHPYVPSTAVPRDIHDLCSTVPNNWPITTIEGATGFDFSKRLNKTVRTMPANAARERAHNLTWIKIRQHTIKHEHQRLHMRAEAIDGFAHPTLSTRSIWGRTTWWTWTCWSS